MKSIYIFGHKNPDTDSVCSAIALANLKNKLGINSVAKVIGPINHGTKYVLDYFNVEYPSYLNDVKVQVKDTNYLKKAYVNINDSVLNTFTFMKNKNINGVPLVDSSLHIKGYITMEDISNYLVNIRYLIDTNLDLLLSTLDAKIITNNTNEFKGTIQSVTFSNDDFISKCKLGSDDILIVGDRYEVIEYAIKCKIKLIILTRNRNIPNKLIKKAIANNVNIITSSYSSFELCNRLSLANHVSIIDYNKKPVTLEDVTYYTDFLNISKKYGYSNYPIINKKKECIGVLKVTDSHDYAKKQVILVDHNNYEQSIDGLNEADILEIIDHHNLGNIGTNIPISFISKPVGCTASIVYEEYKKSNIKPTKQIAGLLLSAIISDTLLFSSPTTTGIDIDYANELARIADIDIKDYGMKMLKEASSIKGLSISELINQDFKTYSINDKTYGIAVITTMDFDSISENIDKYIEKLDEMSSSVYEATLVFIADIFKKGSYVLYNTKSKTLISTAFDIDAYEGIFIPGLLSRKSQIIPKLMKELE